MGAYSNIDKASVLNGGDYVTVINKAVNGLKAAVIAFY
jgi:hypothetical protein